MAWTWCSDWVVDRPAEPKVGRPNRGNRAKVKAGRKAARHR